MGSKSFGTLGALAAGALLCFTVGAADMYRWTDEQGRVHLSDQPPPPSAKSVTRQELPRDEPTPDQRRAAEERAAREQSRLKAIEDERRRTTAPAAAPAAPAANAGATAQRPAQRLTADECRQRREAYFRSHECFAQFIGVNGIKAEAFAVCGPEIKDPGSECNPPALPY